MDDKYTTFKKHDSGTMLIRQHTFRNGKTIAFAISGANLSVLDREVDFDSQSDKLIEENKSAKDHLAFEYDLDIGFQRTPTTQVRWFAF